MASPVVGTILCVAITFVSFGSLIVFAATNHYEKNSCEAAGATHDYYDNTDCSRQWEIQWQEYAEKCRCEPPREESGEPCEPISLPDSFGVAWRCVLKPSLMYPGD